MDSLIQYSRNGLLKKLAKLKQEAIASSELLPFISSWFHEFEKVEDEVLSKILQESELQAFNLELLKISEYFRNEQSSKTAVFRTMKSEDQKGFLIEFYGSADCRKIHTQMMQRLFDPLIELVRSKTEIGYSFVNEELAQTGHGLQINGIEVRDKGRTIEYSGLKRDFVTGSEPWEIVYSCIKPALEGKPREEWGKADVDIVLNILNQKASEGGRSARIRDDIHRLINQINSTWKGKGVKILRVDKVTNEILLQPN